MSSPPRSRRRGSAPMEEIQGPARSTRHRLLEIDAPPAASTHYPSPHPSSSLSTNESRFLPRLRRPSDRGFLEASSAATEALTCGEGNICRGTRKRRQRLPPELYKLPEDMLQHIHSLLPLQDAARAACVSRRFLHSWRCYPNLTLSRITLGMTDDMSDKSEICYISKIDKFFNNYSGSGIKVKKLAIDLLFCKSLSAPCLDRWLGIALKSGINELSLSLTYSMKEKYLFPYSVLFDETANSSIRSLCLSYCIFQPIETPGCFTKLKSLDLYFVHITDDGLNQLLSKSSCLERLQIYACSEIICLKIPCTLQKLQFLNVKNWHKMEVIEISAPYLSTLHYYGFPLDISIGDPSQFKDAYLASFDPSRILSYGCANHPSIARNDERLTLWSLGKNINTGMRPDKHFHLKLVEIKLYRLGRSPVYDIFSVVSCLFAFPALESFILHTQRDAIKHDSASWDDAYLMGELAYQHDRLKRVKITGFHSAKSMIKLVIHILESAPSLESVTLDTTHGCGRKPGDTSKCIAPGGSGKCCWLSESDLKDADGAMEAAGRHIMGRVPPAVEFKLLEPCRRCYAGNR